MRNKLIIIITNGSLDEGFGHIVRQIELARELKNKGMKIEFFAKDEEGMAYIKKGKFNVLEIIDDSSLISKILEVDPKIIIFDRKKNPTSAILKKIRKISKATIICIDNNVPSRKYCDIVIDPTINDQGSRALGTGEKTRYYVGTKYAMIKKEFSQYNNKISEKIRRAFICFGGSDYNTLTLRTINLIEKSNIKNLEIDIVAGKYFNSIDKLKSRIKKTGKLYNKYNLYINPKKISKIMNKADIAIINFGSLFYEASAMGLPCILYNTTRYHNEITDIMIKNFSKELCLNMGYFRDVDCKKFRKYFDLISSLEKRKAISNIQKEIFDGKGMLRVVRIVKQEMIKNNK